MQRLVTPEILDELPPEDARAKQSRRDLVRVNAWMGNSLAMARLVQRHASIRDVRHVVELGAGDGTFMLSVARRLGSATKPIEICLLDRQDLVTGQTLDGFENLGWSARAVRSDVFEWLSTEIPQRIDLVLINLFLHHFADERLRELLRRVAASANVLVACEPRRSTMALIGSRSLWLLGCNAVTRHDAVASVRAGFRDRELSELWPEQDGWQLQEHSNGLFTHCFMAKLMQEAPSHE